MKCSVFFALWITGIVAILMAVTPAHAAAAKPVSFARDVLPIFQGSCAGCHQPGKLKGGLDLTTYEGVQKGGRKGESFKAGDPDHSFIIEQVSGDMPEMPNKGDPLTKNEISTIARWIKEG